MKEGATYEGGELGFGFNAYVYNCLYEAITHERRLANCIPDFIVNESLKHFEKKEQYEKCSTIKRFFDRNPKRMFSMSRADWMNYGWSAVRA